MSELGVGQDGGSSGRPVVGRKRHSDADGNRHLPTPARLKNRWNSSATLAGGLPATRHSKWRFGKVSSPIWKTARRVQGTGGQGRRDEHPAERGHAFPEQRGRSLRGRRGDKRKGPSMGDRMHETEPLRSRCQGRTPVPVARLVAALLFFRRDAGRKKVCGFGGLLDTFRVSVRR